MDFEQALAYCELMYGHPSIQAEGLEIEVFSITPGQQKTTPSYTFYKTPRAAAEAAIRIASRKDNAYACMSLVKSSQIKTKRGKASDSKGIVGFWLDIDIADPLAPKPGKNPPINMGEALEIAKGSGLPPSMIVQSGHGIHAYWLLKQPWLFQSDEEQNYAADTVKGWHYTVQQVARERGRTLDSVFDLARVLRIPGTVNTKNPQFPTDVLLVWPPMHAVQRINRYDLSDIEPRIRAPIEGQADTVVKPEKLKDVEFRTPNTEERRQLEAHLGLAIVNSPRFADTWNHQREDFPRGDYSASEYDMAIANILTELGWTDQHIMWAMYLCREKHGDDTDKVLQRPDYVEITIAKAKKTNVFAVATKELKSANETVEHLKQQLQTTEAPEEKQAIQTQIDEKRNEVFKSASTMLGVNVKAYYKIGAGRNTTYYLELDDDRRISLGTGRDLWEHKAIRTALYNDAQVVVGNLAQPQWLETVKGITHYLEDRPDHTLDLRYRWHNYVMGLIDEAPVYPAATERSDNRPVDVREEQYDTMSRKKAFWLQNGSDDRELLFNLESLKSGVAKDQRENIPYTDLTETMRAIGCAPRKMSTPRVPERKRLTRYWWYIKESQLKAIERQLQEEYAKYGTHDYTNEDDENDNSVT